jgi:hypothetical protein
MRTSCRAALSYPSLARGGSDRPATSAFLYAVPLFGCWDLGWRIHLRAPRAMISARRVVERVIVALILSAIFGLIANCAKAFEGDVTGSINGSQYGAVAMSGTMSGEGSLTNVVIGGTFTTQYGGMLGRIRTRTGTTWSAWGDTGGWTQGQTISINATYSAWELQPNLAWQGFGYSGSITWYRVPPSTGKNIPLSVTNTSGAAKWYGVVDAANPDYVGQMQMVLPGQTYSTNVFSAPGDTKSYQLVEVNMNKYVGDTGSAAVTTYANPGTGEVYAHMPGYVTPIGAPKGANHADAVAGVYEPTAAMPGLPGGTLSTVPSVRKPGDIGNTWTMTSATPTAAATNGTIAEGTNAITGAINALTNKIGTGTGGSGGTDMSGVHTRLDSVITKLEGLKTKKHHEDEEKAAKEAATTATDSGKSQGAAAGAAEKALLGTAITSGPNISTPGDMSSSLTIVMPLLFGGGSVDFNPFRSDRMGTVASWFKSAMAWLCLMHLATFIWGDMGNWIRGFSQVRQAQGNTVAAGTGAQATALVAAGLMTTAIVTAMTALVGWSLGDISFAYLKSIATTNVFTSMAAVAYWMLSQVLPVDTIVACLVARFSFRFYGASVFATCAAVIRFIVP